MNSDEKLTCPECGSDQVTLTHEQAFMANTGEHWCHTVKIQDHDSKSKCLDCGWRGLREDLRVEAAE